VQELEVRRRIGARIRELRLAKALTQDEFGDLSGLNRAHVGELERGECNVTIRTLKILADAFDVRIADLVRDV
jgi:transcriptional regulator with XRE-family HTH domain